MQREAELEANLVGEARKARLVELAEHRALSARSVASLVGKRVAKAHGSFSVRAVRAMQWTASLLVPPD